MRLGLRSALGSDSPRCRHRNADAAVGEGIRPAGARGALSGFWRLAGDGRGWRSDPTERKAEKRGADGEEEERGGSGGFHRLALPAECDFTAQIGFVESDRVSQVPALGDDFGEDDAALFDAFVVPSYLSLFTAAARPLLLVGEAGRLVHLGCRTGYPDPLWLEAMPSTTGVGVDGAQSFLSIAGSRLGAMNMRYVFGNPARSGLESQTFSHSVSFHPTRNAKGRIALFAEMARLLYSGGQALVALPFGDSFQEVLDLVGEYALKHDESELEAAFDGVSLHRGTPEQLMEELKSVGLSDVGIDVQEQQIPFESGRAFVEDPAVRLLVLPLVAAWLGRPSLPEEAREYLARAIDKYWSDTAFELRVQIAAVSARR